MHVPYPPISGGRILTEGHRNTFALENAVDGLGMADVLFGPVYSLRRVGRSSLSTTNEPAWRLVFLCPEFSFLPWFPPFASQCLCEFKALKVLVSYGPEYRNELFGGGYMGKWVNGFLAR